MTLNQNPPHENFLRTPLVWLHFPEGDVFSEEMLPLLPLTGQTRRQDIHSALMSFFRGPGKTINLKILVPVTTDEAPFMV